MCILNAKKWWFKAPSRLAHYARTTMCFECLFITISVFPHNQIAEFCTILFSVCLPFGCNIRRFARFFAVFFLNFKKYSFLLQVYSSSTKLFLKDKNGSNWCKWFIGINCLLSNLEDKKKSLQFGDIGLYRLIFWRKKNCKDRVLPISGCKR